MTRPTFQQVYQQLFDHFGPQHWWPAKSPFEVVIGAILTQNTAWSNVEKAIDNLRESGHLTAQALNGISQQELEPLIQPSGFFRQKSARLKKLAALLVEQHQGEIERFCHGDLEEARQRLLTLKGIGPETADSILLYACERPSFVVDAYTRRLFSRLRLLRGDEDYAHIRQRFMDNLPEDTHLFNEYHALIVAHCKRHCRKRKPECPACPLLKLCPFALTI
ncbi:MAG: endonuclease [Desulfuromonas sp.]|nr:MAG: endonuclease [Desulfuromonas sp.]